MSPSLSASLAALRVQPLEIHARAVEAIELPAFAGSTLRGAFLSALLDLVCVAPERVCESCALRHDCAFPPFGAPRAAREGRGEGTQVDSPLLASAPAAFVLDAGGESSEPRRIDPGQEFRFGLTLLGRAAQSVPLLAAALQRMGERGLSGSRGRFTLVSIERSLAGEGSRAILAGDPPQLCTAGERGAARVGDVVRILVTRRAEIRFDAPVRLVRDGRLVRDLDFATLVRALLRRAARVLAAHEGVAVDAGECCALAARASAVATVQASFAPVDRRRYSARQARAMNLRGVVGRLVVEGDLAPFSALLAFGEVAGVGKGTTFGLGRLRVVAAAPDESHRRGCVPVAAECLP